MASLFNPFRYGVVSLVLGTCGCYFFSALIVCHGDNLPLSQGKAAQLCAAYIVSEFSPLRFVRAGVAAGFSSSHFL